MMSKTLERYLELEKELNLELMLMHQLELHYFDSLKAFTRHYFIKDDEVSDFLASYHLDSLYEVSDFIIFYSSQKDEYIHLKDKAALDFFINSDTMRKYLKKAD